MAKFDSKEFIDKLDKRMGDRDIPTCPYCGGEKFTTTNQFANIISRDDFGKLELSNAIPAGMIICERCGHIEFFALGALGLIKKEEVNEDGKKDN